VRRVWTMTSRAFPSPSAIPICLTATATVIVARAAAVVAGTAVAVASDIDPPLRRSLCRTVTGHANRLTRGRIRRRQEIWGGNDGSINYNGAGGLSSQKRPFAGGSHR